MAWAAWYTSFSDAFKKRAGRYLINKYLGTFLDETVSLDQLTVDGDISLSNVALNIRTINSLIDSADLPVEFVDGYISDLTVTIPWANLLTESCFFSISGLTITLQVKKRANPAQISASIFHSMCESFSSFSVAEECMKAEDVHSSPGKNRSTGTEEDIVAGVELLAQAIDSVIMRVQVKLSDSTVRMEYMPGLEQRGIALELQVGKIVYSGEAGSLQQQEQFSTSTIRKVFLEDISLSTDEFSLVSNISPCTSMQDSRYNSIRKDRRESVGSNESSETIHDDKNEPKDDLDPPLRFATLSGRQELVLKFTEMNQFGLPRAVDEVEVGLGRLSFHIYPHQVHILTEIASAITVPPKPAVKAGRQQKHLMMGLEGLLQENLRLGAGGVMGQQGLNVGWGDRDLDASREFMPVSAGMPSISKSQGFLTDERTVEQQQNNQPPMPRILVRLASCVGILHMRDPGIIKLGGEPTRSLAMLAMRTSADSFFCNHPSLPVWEERKLSSWHHALGNSIGSSHAQILATPINIVYEEGTSIGPGLSSNYAAITTVTLGKVSVVEHLVDTCNATQAELIHLLRFSLGDSVPSKKSPDIKLVYKDTYELGESVPTSTLTLALNSCNIDLDPGIVDRTYLLLNYADMDPDCIRTVAAPPTTSNSNITVTITSPAVAMAFHIPKPDMRNPHDIGPEFIRTFWTRKVHPEIFQIQLDDFSLSVSQGGGSLAPLSINLSSATVEINYQESPSSSQFPIIQARRLGTCKDRNQKSFAMEIDITVCMDDSLKLQGKFNSKQQKMEKSVLRKKSSGSPDELEYFVVDPDSGYQNDSGSRPGFLQQQDDILAALKQAAIRNNLLLDIKLDAVSLVMPSKTLYEVIYNRLGNDMLLWLPQYMAVKEHIYGETVVNPLHDDAQEFSGCFSGRPEAIEPPPRPKHTTAFPKDRQSGALEIHTDTTILLNVNQAQLLVCIPMDTETDILGLLHISTVGMSLVCAVGLDKEPEISIFTLRCVEGCVKYGGCAKTSLPAQLHFNPSLPGLSVLLTTNSYCDRAWPQRPDNTDLLNLTAKVLLDTTSNLKSIQLAFKLVQVGLCVRDPSTGPDWINALVDFFTVVEFPVLGYQPPAVLTEMHFQLVQCGVELAPPVVSPVRAALCLGKVGISCSLLDTTADASVTVSVEDAAIYLSKDSVAPIDNTVCVADIDYVDLSVTLSEPEHDPTQDDAQNSDSLKATDPTLLVTASTNLIRVRTCADTLQLLAELGGGLATVAEQESSSEMSEEGSDVTLGQQSEDMLPDLEDAMVELTEKKVESTEKEKPKPAPSSVPGAQIFYFPGEGQQSPPSHHVNNSSLTSPMDLMTQSIYIPQSNVDPQSDEESSDLESFCILEEEEGSGIVPSGGGPAVRCLSDGPVNIVDNHFSVPQVVIDHLKGPKGFPLPQLKLSLTKLSLVWQIFGGNDFSSSKEMRHNTKAKLEQMGLSLTPEGMKAKRTLNVNNGVGSAIAAADYLKTRGGPGRNSDLLIELVVSKMAAQHEVYPLADDVNTPVTRQIVLIPHFEVRDKLAGSEINKLLHGYNSKTRPRQSSAYMLHIKNLTVRPDPASQLEETSLKVSLQPFRLNIDQDTLFFIIDFANTLVPTQSESELGKSPSPGPGQSIKYSSGMQAIQIEVPDGAEVFEDAQSSPPKSPPTEAQSTPRSKSSTPGPSTAAPGNIYFKSFVFSPSVPIRVDYVGKYVDLTQGALTGILAGLAQLNCSELTLKQLDLKAGILGIDKLLATAATAWLADIRSSQLPALLGGVGPMHAFLQLLLGIRDLVLLPIEQYRKDGRIVRGLQKGTTSFTHSTTLSFLDVTNKFLTVIKFAAELAFDVMSPDGCVVYGKLPHPARDCKRKAGRSQVRRARGTPADFREGMLGAMQLVREGLDETARSLAVAAGDRSGMAGAVGGVLRAVPSTMVRPVILGAAATSNLLDGVKNQISPDQRAEEEDKWKTHHS